MPAILTEEEFSKHVNTKFRVRLGPEVGVDLDLTEVKGYMSTQHEQKGLERFSLYFNGPIDSFLPQLLYTLTHDQMGELEIFIVPIGKNDSGFRYESVFNYFK
jgi:hypothetical protein